MSYGLNDFITGMPKAELHVHIEGCVEPLMLLRLAERNGVDIPYRDEDEVWAAQDYGEPALDNFLKYHENCLRVLQTGQDFYELAYAFFKRSAEENIVYLEIMFETQAHISRGLVFSECFDGLNQARRDGRRDFGIESNWIMSFQRDHSAESSMEILDMAKPFKDEIIGVGLDNYEVNNFALKFVEVFRRAREEGYRLTSHCDCNQQNSIEHIRQCLELLQVERIDHGLHVIDSPELTAMVRESQIPLTMCPTWRPSDPAPRRLESIREMLELGLLVSINTDDPAEFASRYLNNIFIEMHKHGSYTKDEIVRLTRNAFTSAWISEDAKAHYLEKLEKYVAGK